jgi:hypothetical protein
MMLLMQLPEHSSTMRTNEKASAPERSPSTVFPEIRAATGKLTQVYFIAIDSILLHNTAHELPEKDGHPAPQ